MNYDPDSLDLQKKILIKAESLIEASLEKSKFNLVRVKFIKECGDFILQVMIENKNGEAPSLEDCYTVSGIISIPLDEEDLISIPHRLEVSSPGVERPLVKEKDFARWKDHKVKLLMDTTFESPSKRIKGIINDVNNGTLLLTTLPSKKSPVSEHLSILLSQIEEATLIADESILKSLLKSHKESSS